MTTIQKTYRIDEELQQFAVFFFSVLGWNPTGAITMFFKRVVDEKRMPFVSEVISERVDYSMESKERLSDLLSKIPVNSISDISEIERKELLDGWQL